MPRCYPIHRSRSLRFRDDAGTGIAPAGRPNPRSVKPLVSAAGAAYLVHRHGHLYVYRSAEGLQKDRLAWELRRENGVEIDEFDADELRQGSSRR